MPGGRIESPRCKIIVAFAVDHNPNPRSNRSDFPGPLRYSPCGLPRSDADDGNLALGGVGPQSSGEIGAGSTPFATTTVKRPEAKPVWEQGRHGPPSGTHGLPFLSLRNGQDQIVLIEQRHAGQVTGGVGWIQRQLGEKPSARWVAACGLSELEGPRGAFRRPLGCGGVAVRTSTVGTR